MDDFEIGCANRNRIDANQDLSAPRYRRRLLAQGQLIGPAEHPGLHPVRDNDFGGRLDAGVVIHGSASLELEFLVLKVVLTLLGAAAIGISSGTASLAQSVAPATGLHSSKGHFSPVPRLKWSKAGADEPDR